MIFRPSKQNSWQFIAKRGAGCRCPFGQHTSPKKYVGISSLISRWNSDLSFHRSQKQSVKTKNNNESLIKAAQDQTLSTIYYKKNISKQETDEKCRRFHTCNEYKKHIVAGCTLLAPCEYFIRRNKVHWKVCKDLGIPVAINGTNINQPPLRERNMLWICEAWLYR